ncbi:hypothetical protein [Mycobacterium heckeshornense]|uniref:Uncharacterized protein n=1 Tax=Mycobacterium heckeshornense TaxID=110505 RepID=A0A7R7GYN2_9MYCO|nr:hypothetical protein [Mycobacterium heckeshornense]MCV7034248.1 hypothetical protein [Mycobacterium heckeshornense]BCO38322.1 hypothetical protein MHEC_47550 [Mycobacterium heckeshornense]
MTQPDRMRGAENQRAQERLCRELLISGLYDQVPLAQVESVITRDDLAQTVAAQQELALSAIRSLVDAGLMEFDGWEDLPLDAAMSRVYDLFVNHYDDPGTWAFSVWLKLTEAGAQYARELKSKTAP